MPSGSSRSPAMRALTISRSAPSPCSDDALGAVEHPAARGRFGRRQHIGQVVARLPLAMREGQGHLAFGDLRQDRRFLRLVAGQAQRGAAQHDRRQIRFERQDPAERLHDQHDLDRAAAKPAMFLGEGQTQAGPARHSATTAPCSSPRVRRDSRGAGQSRNGRRAAGRRLSRSRRCSSVSSKSIAHSPHRAPRDCFVAAAPRNDTQIGVIASGAKQSRSPQSPNTALVRMFFWISLVPP